MLARVILFVAILIGHCQSFSFRPHFQCHSIQTNRYSLSNHKSILRQPIIMSTTTAAPEEYDTTINNSLEPSSTRAAADNTATKRTPIGSTPEFNIEGDSTEETSHQRLVVATHFMLTFISLSSAVQSLLSAGPVTLAVVAKTTAAIALSIVLGDFGTGVFHWSVDNYGSIKTPVFGSVCVAFQGHHQTPWTITFRSFANNVFKIAYATIPVLALIIAASNMFHLAPNATIFLTLFTNWWLISQELHKFSHMKQVPDWVRFLQDRGVILSRKEHGLHHLAPYEAHYCILTGACNAFLDKIKFFRYLEYLVFQITGNKPNTWKEDPKVEQLAISLYKDTGSGI